MSKEENKKTQPEPTVMDYSQNYKITDLFIDHLKECLRNMPQYKAAQYVKFATDHKDCINIVDLNGFVKKLGLIEYGFIAQLIDNIENPNGQKQYFVPIPKEQKK